MLTYPQGGGAGLSELSSGDARDDKRLSGVTSECVVWGF